MKGVVVFSVVLVGCVLVSSGFVGVVRPVVAAQAPAADSFDAVMTRVMSLGHISGASAAIVENESMVWAEGYGLANRETSLVAAPASIYLVASISKTMTATALMQLYEQGLFGLDDDISSYLGFTLRNPAFPDVPVTFRMLLAHHSSLATDPVTDFTRVFPADLQITGYPDPFYRELLVPGGLHYIPQMWSLDAPGSAMHYANLGFGVLGFLVERLSGENFSAYCREHIFLPLEMENTSFWIGDLNASRLARPYQYLSGGYEPYMQYTMLDYPAGGLRTTVVDLSHFLIAQMNQGRYKDVQLLSPETIALMHTPQYQNHSGYDFTYGLGFQIWEHDSGNEVGHSGGLYGVSTFMRFQEGHGTGVILFCNRQTQTLRDRFTFAVLVACLSSKARHLGGPVGVSLFEALSETRMVGVDFPGLSR